MIGGKGRFAVIEGSRLPPREKTDGVLRPLAPSGGLSDVLEVPATQISCVMLNCDVYVGKEGAAVVCCGSTIKTTSTSVTGAAMG